MSAKEELKSAREIFEELGYVYSKDEEGIYYSKYFIETDCYMKIEFIFGLKDIFIYLENNASNVYTSICLHELKAINKQVEELGWND